MKSYSLDLRKKIIEAYEKRDRSQRELARSFGVARSFIQKLRSEISGNRQLCS
jgi:transposase